MSCLLDWASLTLEPAVQQTIKEFSEEIMEFLASYRANMMRNAAIVVSSEAQAEDAAPTGDDVAFYGDNTATAEDNAAATEDNAAALEDNAATADDNTAAIENDALEQQDHVPLA